MKTGIPKTLLWLLVLGITMAIAAPTQTETLKKQIASLDAQMDQTRKTFDQTRLDLAKASALVEAAKKEVADANSTDARDRANAALFRQESAYYDLDQDLKELADTYNRYARQKEQAQYDLLQAELARRFNVEAFDYYTCRGLALESCKQLAYSAARRTMEAKARETLLEIAKELELPLKEGAMEKMLRTLTDRLATKDEGYYYTLDGLMYGTIAGEPDALLSVQTLVWEPRMEPPKHAEPVAKAQELNATEASDATPQDTPERVYHSGVFAALLYGMETHRLTGDTTRDADGYAIGIGIKGKDKGKFAFHYATQDDGKTTLTQNTLLYTWGFDLDTVVYPSLGIAYSIATARGEEYLYEGNGMYALAGVAWEATPWMEVELAYRYGTLSWTVANHSVSIVDLGIGRDVQGSWAGIHLFF